LEELDDDDLSEELDIPEDDDDLLEDEADE